MSIPICAFHVDVSSYARGPLDSIPLNKIPHKPLLDGEWLMGNVALGFFEGL